MVSDDSMPMHRAFKRKSIDSFPRCMVAMTMSTAKWPPCTPMPACSLPLWEAQAWQGLELCCLESLTPMVGSPCLPSLSISTCACIMIAQLVPHRSWNCANHYVSNILLIALISNFSSCWFSLVSSWLLFASLTQFSLFPFICLPLFKFT